MANQTPDESRPPERPSLRLYNREWEDWTVLAERDDERPLDWVKFIPIGDLGQSSLSIGGAARLRYEYFNNFNLDQSNDDGYLLSHVRLHADLRIRDDLRLFAEIKSAWITDRDLPGGTRPIDEDQLDIQQAWGSYRFALGDDSAFEIRAGRHQLNFGAQRLVSPLPWANTFRAWDGVVANLELNSWTITPFFTAFAPVERVGFNSTDTDLLFGGVYASGLIYDSTSADVYYLAFRDADGALFNGTTGVEERHTVGGRLFRSRKPGRFDFDVEGAYQFGSVGSGDVSAYFVDGKIGWSFADRRHSPRVAIGAGVASGDDHEGGDVQTFNHLFPLGHAYLGYADVLGRQNVIELRTSFEISPIDRLKLRAGYHMFWKESTSDAVYGPGGQAIRPGGSSTERFLGSEADVTATYTFSEHASVEVGYNHFFAGDVFGSSLDTDLDFVYMQLIVKF